MFGGNTSGAESLVGASILFMNFDASPYVAAYVCYPTGLGNRYSNPTTLPSSYAILAQGNGIAFSNSILADLLNTPGTGSVVMYSTDAYAWSLAGFGTKYASPATALSNFARCIALNKVGTTGSLGGLGAYYRGAIFGINGSPYVNAYMWIEDNGYGTKFTTPTGPTADVTGAAFSPNGLNVVLAAGDSSTLHAYTWDNTTGFGTKFTAPSSPLTFGRGGISFTPSSTNIAVIYSASTSPYIAAYRWGNSSGFGTRYTNPSVAAASFPYAVAVNATGTAVAVASQSSPYITAYPWTYASGFGTKYADPVDPLPNLAFSVAFSPDNKVIAIGHANPPYISLYEWSDVTGFGNKLPDPLLGLTAAPRGLSFTGIL